MSKDKVAAADPVDDEIDTPVDDNKILDVTLDEYLSPEERAALKDDDEAEGLDEILADQDAAIKDEEVEKPAVVDVIVEKPVVNDDSYKPSQVRMDVKPVEDFDNKIADFNKQLDDLLEKLDNGDITLKEYSVESRKIQKEETEITLQQREALNATSFNKRLDEAEVEFATNQWSKTVDKFLKQESNVLYTSNEQLNAALDKTVKYLATTEPEADPSYYLEESDRILRARYPALFGDKEKPVEKTIEDPKKSTTRKPNLTDIPKTLSNLPSADTNETGDSEFAYLDKLTGFKLEQAIALIAKDPAKEERYTRSQ